MAEAAGDSAAELARRRHSLPPAAAAVDIDTEGENLRRRSGEAVVATCDLMTCWTDDLQLTLRVVASSTMGLSY
jgi:hypothetical protein